MPCPKEPDLPETSRQCAIPPEIVSEDLSQEEANATQAMEAQEFLPQEEKPKDNLYRSVINKGNLLVASIPFFILLVLLAVSVYEFRVHMGPKIRDMRKLVDDSHIKTVNSYINRMHMIGRGNKEIKNSLLSVGWPENIVDNLLHSK